MRTIEKVYLAIFVTFLITAPAAAEKCSDFYAATCREKSKDELARLAALKASLLAPRSASVLQVLTAHPEAVEEGIRGANLEGQIAACSGGDTKLSSLACRRAYASFITDFSILQQTDGRDNAARDQFLAKHFSGVKSVEMISLNNALSRLGIYGLDFQINKPDSKKPAEYSDAEKTRIFDDAKASVLKVIARLPISEKARAELARVASQTELANERCQTGLNSEDASRASYLPLSGVVVVCGKYIAKTVSEGALFAIMSHEIGHSVDPCTLGFSKTERSRKFLMAYKPEPFLGKTLKDDEYDFRKLDAWYPVPRLAQCLRTENSLRARPAIPYLKSQDDDGDSTDIVVTARARKKPDSSQNAWAQICGAQIASGVETPKDKISESVADWFAAEALAEKKKTDPQFQVKTALEDFAGVLCDRNVDRAVKDNRMSPHWDSHPLNSRRLSHVFLAQPRLRESVACEAGAETYCDASSAPAAMPDFALDHWPRNQLKDSVDEVLTRPAPANPSRGVK